MWCERKSSLNLLSVIVEPLKGATGRVAGILSIRSAYALSYFIRKSTLVQRLDPRKLLRQGGRLSPADDEGRVQQWRVKTAYVSKSPLPQH